MGITPKSLRTIFSPSKKTDQSDTTKESSNGTTTTAHNSNSSEMGTATRIKNTPFTLVGNDQRGYFIGYGHAQITNTFLTKKQALNQLNSNHWEVICNMMAYTVEHWAKLKESVTKRENAARLTK